MDSIQRIHSLSVTDDPVPDRLKDGTVRPAGFRLNGGTGEHFKDRTDRMPRPTEADFTSPQQLAHSQNLWDQADYLRRWRLQLDQEHQDELAAKRAEKDRIKQEEDARFAAARREELLAPARRAFLSAGGTQAEWDAQKDSIAADILKAQAVQAVTTPSITPLISRYGA